MTTRFHHPGPAWTPGLRWLAGILFLLAPELAAAQDNGVASRAAPAASASARATDGSPAGDLPFQRILDLTLFSGFPDAIGASIEAHPFKGLGIAIYGSFYKPLFDYTMGVKYSYLWNMVLRPAEAGGWHQLAFGLMLGTRYAFLSQQLRFDIPLSLVYTRWFRPGLGIVVGLDAGMFVQVPLPGGHEDIGLINPLARLQVGIAF